jgi:alcohol dehydrogenase YqhD (iron-dependent ADH family)
VNNFVFHNPTKIIFGKGTAAQVGDETAAWAKKVLLVYGQSSIKRSGLYDQTLGALKKAGVAVAEHGGVRPNPVLSHVRDGVKRAKSEKVEAVLAVGGGSVLDSAKAIAAGARADGDVWDLFIGKAKLEAALPVIDILTVPATGSEMNGTAVVTNEETKQKYGFGGPPMYPKVSILDPSLTLTISVEYSAYAAVDAISHLLEGYFTGADESVPLQDRLVECTVRTIMESVEAILKNPKDYEARATFMWCATLAWNGLMTAGIGGFGAPSHMLEHPLSALYDIAHGAGLSITIPAWMKYAAGKGNRKVARFGERIFGVTAGSEADKARKGIEAFEAWFRKIGSPVRFGEARIPAGEIPEIAANARDLAEAWGLTDYSQEIIAGIYRDCV